MTKEDMIRMAHESGWQYAHGDSGYEPLWAFAALIASAEREACANAMAQIVMTPTLTHGALVKLSDVVNAIRARGQA